MIFESHAHYDDRQFNEDRDELLTSMQAHGIQRIINIGCSIDSCKRTLEMVEKYDFIYGALGVHPSDIKKRQVKNENGEIVFESEGLDEESFSWMKDQLSHEKIVAVGEIGLDYYWEKDPEVRDLQKYWFRRQLGLAKEANLPVVIHSREAAEHTMEIMKEAAADQIPGVIHCFSYSKEIALEYVKMGYYIGVGGVVTYNNARKLKEAVCAIPLERILLETDCPYLSPVPYRGKRNSSLYLPRVVTEIAQLKGVSEEEVMDVTYQNAMTLFSKVR